MKWLSRILAAILLSLCAIILYQFVTSFNVPTKVFALPDINLFSNTNCLTACWNDLRPGQTKADTVFAALQNEPYRNWRQISRFADNYAMYSANNPSGFNVTTIIKDNDLYRIQIGATRLKLTTADVINALGNPLYTLIDYEVGSEVMVLQAYATLYYPDKGYVFSLRNSDGLNAQFISGNQVKICLNKDANISQVDIVQVGSIKDMLQALKTPYEKITDSELELEINNLRDPFSFSCLNLPYP